MPDFKPELRRRDPDLLRILHLERGECALCGEVEFELHHVLSRAQGGDDVRENIVKLCAERHGEITHNEEGARRALGEHLLAARWDVLDYLESKLGEEAAREWLARRLFVEWA